LKIRIFYEETNYRFRGWRKAAILFMQILKCEGKQAEEINIIITNDNILKTLNVKYLNHNYNTDVIAFNYNSGIVLNGEIYISKDTVKLNAHNYNVSLDNEMLRVMIHGLLHLSGYNDKTDREKKRMHEQEDKWLRRFYNKEDGF